MIAGPPSALALFLQRLRERREENRRRLNPPAGAVDGGKLVAEPAPRALPPPSNRPQAGSALTAPPSPPPNDILSIPDRDHLRTVVPDYDHLDYGARVRGRRDK